jgi:gamma-butyrobetaine dioxygenase
MCTSEKKLFNRKPSPLREIQQKSQKSTEKATPSHPSSVSVYNNGIEIPRESQGPMMFHWVWLRDHCQCSECISSSGQKLYRIEEFRPSVDQAASVEESNQGIRVTWYDGHVSEYTTSWMEENAYDADSLRALSAKGHTLAWNRKILESGGGIPQFDYGHILESEEALHGWLSELDATGLTLLNGAPLARGAVSRVCNRVGYPRNTMYGLQWDVESVPNPNNLAYTALPLPLHADLCYYESPPGVQLLHCINFEQRTGGVNTFVDAFKVAQDLQSIDPASFDVLTRVLTTFHKNDADYYLKYAHPIIQLSHNAREIEAINWSPPFEGTQQIAPQDVAPYYKARRVWSDLLNNPEYTIQHRLLPGQIVVFNNRRVLHARSAFDPTQGHRLLEGAYLGSDEWVQKLRVLNRKYAPGAQIHYGSGYHL